MSTNLNTQVTSPRAITNEAGSDCRRGGLGFPAGEEASWPEAGQAGAHEPGGLSRRDAEVRDRLQANRLALLEKLDSNHRELLAVLGRQGARVSALEAGFARLDERTQ